MAEEAEQLTQLEPQARELCLSAVGGAFELLSGLVGLGILSRNGER